MNHNLNIKPKISNTTENNLSVDSIINNLPNKINKIIYNKATTAVICKVEKWMYDSMNKAEEIIRAEKNFKEAKNFTIKAI